MKPSQIATGMSYEDKRMEIIRRVTAMIASGDGKVVEYIEDSASSKPLYLPLRKPQRLLLAKFAKWAARPAGTKKLLCEQKFTNWLRGPTDRLVRSR